MSLAGKSAVVTGGDQGIGRGIALRLAREGANVVINFRSNQDKAEETTAEIRRLGRTTAALRADVANTGELQKLYAKAKSTLGSIDILVNNSGVEKKAEFVEVTEDDYESVLAVDLKAPFFLSQLFAKDLISTKRKGKIINVSSIHEELPFPNFTPYCIAKGGLKMMCRNLAVELAPHGITVNNIAPGAIDTPINASLMADPSKLRPLQERIPLARVGSADDVAGCAAFLASEDADYITGTSLIIDGGLIISYKEQ